MITSKRNPHSASTKSKISEALKTSERAREQRRRLAEMRRGIPRSGITKARISEALKGKPLSPETRKKMSIVHKGKQRSPEYRANISKARKASPRAREQLERLWELNRGKPRPEKCKAKLRQARLKQRIPSSNTEPEKRFQSICEILQLPFKYVGDGAFWVENINPDFVDSDGQKIAVEVFGDYWHTPLFRKKAYKIQRTEGYRKRVLRKYGWQLIVFWESELNLPDAKERVLKKLEKFYGRR